MRPHPSTCATIPQRPGCRPALRPNLSSTSGGHRRGSLGQGIPCPSLRCLRDPVLSLPQTGVFIMCVSISLRERCAYSRRGDVLGAGADGRRLWRLVVRLEHALRIYQARGGVFFGRVLSEPGWAGLRDGQDCWVGCGIVVGFTGRRSWGFGGLRDVVRIWICWILGGLLGTTGWLFSVKAFKTKGVEW